MTLRDLVLRLRALLFPRRVERELDEELAFHIERDAVAQAVEAGTRELVGDCLDGNYAMALGGLSLVPAPDRFAETNRQVCGFDVGPA